MKLFKILFLFAVIAMVVSFGTIGSAEPLPEPRGRPPTTKKSTSDKDDGGSDR